MRAKRQVYKIVGLFIMKVSELIEELQKAKKEHGDLDVGIEISGYYTGATECLDTDGISVSTRKIGYINIHNMDQAYGKVYIMVSGENE